MLPTRRLVGVAFRISDDVGSRKPSNCVEGMFVSGLIDAAYALAVYASSPGFPSVATQDSLSGWWPPLTGRDLNPLGPKVCFLLLHGFPLTQALPGAPEGEHRRARRPEM